MTDASSINDGGCCLMFNLISTKRKGFKNVRRLMDVFTFCVCHCLVFRERESTCARESRSNRTLNRGSTNTLEYYLLFEFDKFFMHR